jgi:hypothetical protein
MNTDTGAVKREAYLTDDEKKSGKWVKLADLPRGQRIKMLAKLRAKPGAKNLGTKLTDGIGQALRQKHRYTAQLNALKAAMADAAVKGLVRFQRDGDKWCAVLPTFVNLQESPAGFGPTKLDAFMALRDDAAKHIAMRQVASDAPACAIDPEAVAADAVAAQVEATKEVPDGSQDQ